MAGLTLGRRSTRRVHAAPLPEAGAVTFGSLAVLATVLAWIEVPLALSNSLLLIVLALAAKYMTSPARRLRIPSVIDLAMVAGAFVYSVTPAVVAFLFDYEPPPSLALQQLLIAACVAAFMVARDVEGYATWRVATEQLFAPPSPLTHHRLRILGLITGVWALLAIVSSIDFMQARYGTRVVDQRSSLTLLHVGFDYFATVATALFVERVRRARRDRRRVLLFCSLALLAYGALLVAIFHTRTKLVFTLALIGCLWLLSTRITWRKVAALSLGVYLLLPIFDVIGRARGLDRGLGTRSIQRAWETTQDIGFGEMAINSEIVGMAEHAERVLGAFGNDGLLLGRYIGYAIIQAPPAFVLRPLGLEEIRSFSKEYALYLDAAVYHAGGGFGMPLAGEAYCNFGLLGGLLTGLIAFVFVWAFERASFRFLPGALLLPLAIGFAITIARIHRNGLESIPKVLLVHGVLIAIWVALRSVRRDR